MKMRKHFDNINMNKDKPAFDNEDKVEMADTPDFKPTVTVQEEKPEVFEHEGVKIYEKNAATGDVKYFDTEGKEVSTRVVDTLFEKYPAPPEFNQQGGEKEGELQITNSTYTKHGNEKFEGGKEPEYVSERQKYTEGDTHIATIPKEYYMLVKFLRGDYSGK